MKIGIVGLGSIGKRHALNATKLGHDVHIYDPVVKGDFRFRYERDLYDWCDAAVIATPSQVHESGLRACVERGKHSYVEKPISIAIGQLPQLLDIAAQKDLVVMMGNNLRMHPCVQMAKRWISEGSIGKPLWANFICSTLSAKAPYLSDGVILNTGAHEVDLALYMLGPAQVICASARVGAYGDDLANFVLQHESGARSSFVLNFVTPNEVREFWIAGEDDNIGIDLPKRHITCQRMGASNGPGSYDDDYCNAMRAFAERINGRIAPGATGSDGLATLKVLLAVRDLAGIK